MYRKGYCRYNPAQKRATPGPGYPLAPEIVQPTAHGGEEDFRIGLRQLGAGDCIPQFKITEFEVVLR